MKLIFCPKCRDIVNLRIGNYRTCLCKASGGKYIDGKNAEIDGDAIPLGIHNGSFFEALDKQPDVGPGANFKAFVIERECPTITRTERPKHLRPKAGPVEWETQINGLSVNQRKLSYAICLEPTAHPRSSAYMTKHKLAGGIAGLLTKLKASEIIGQDSEQVWWIRDNGMQQWLHERLSSRPPDEADADWCRCFEQQKASFITIASKEFGDKEKALAWLNSPCYSLCDHVPMEILERPGGFEQLCQYLAWRNAS